MKTFRFVDNSSINVDESVCRGCFLEEAKELPVELKPIWINSFFVIRQDAECPVPGFYIISARKHINTIGDLDINRATELGAILNRLRQAMLKVLGIRRIHIILEERIVEPHLHIWMLPLWPEVMEEYKIDPKVWNSNIYEYMSLFSYEANKEKILLCNEQISNYLKKDPVLMQYQNK